MQKHNKKYGYVIALWERGRTIPSLFRKVSDWKKARGIRTTSLWKVMIDPSWAPWPIRPFLRLIRNRNADGDLWNVCHFWSNFEIADMEFFRSPEYRDFFEFLDADGGFYFERVSDPLLFQCPALSVAFCQLFPLAFTTPLYHVIAETGNSEIASTC